MNTIIFIICTILCLMTIFGNFLRTAHFSISAMLRIDKIRKTAIFAFVGFTAVNASAGSFTIKFGDPACHAENTPITYKTPLDTWIIEGREYISDVWSCENIFFTGLREDVVGIGKKGQSDIVGLFEFSLAEKARVVPTKIEIEFRFTTPGVRLFVDICDDKDNGMQAITDGTSFQTYTFEGQTLAKYGSYPLEYMAIRSSTIAWIKSLTVYYDDNAGNDNGITVSADPDDAILYNLYGRPVNTLHAAPGVYIRRNLSNGNTTKILISD